MIETRKNMIMEVFKKFFSHNIIYPTTWESNSLLLINGFLSINNSSSESESFKSPPINLLAILFLAFYSHSFRSAWKQKLWSLP